MTNVQRGSVSRRTVLGRAASLTIRLITVASFKFPQTNLSTPVYILESQLFENNLVFACLFFFQTVCIISSLPAALLFLPNVVTHWLLPHPCVYICVWSVAHPPLTADDGRVNLGALDEIPLFCFVHLRGF